MPTLLEGRQWPYAQFLDPLPLAKSKLTEGQFCRGHSGQQHFIVFNKNKARAVGLLLLKGE